MYPRSHTYLRLEFDLYAISVGFGEMWISTEMGRETENVQNLYSSKPFFGLHFSGLSARVFPHHPVPYLTRDE